MLRAKSETLAETPPVYGEKTETGVPSTDVPFQTEERPVGVAFYRVKDSFFLPYHLLQVMRYRPEEIFLKFAHGDVVISGRGLHPLYVQLAAQRVCRIVEQGERYSGADNAVIFIARIQEIPRQKKEKKKEEAEEADQENDEENEAAD